MSENPRRCQFETLGYFGQHDSNSNGCCCATSLLQWTRPIQLKRRAEMNRQKLLRLAKRARAAEPACKLKELQKEFPFTNALTGPNCHVRRACLGQLMPSRRLKRSRPTRHSYA